MTWPKVKLSACCISIADGDHQPPPKADSGVPFVTIANIDTFHSLNFENAMHVPREYYDGLDSKRRATAGDVLYSVVGSFGIPVLVKDNTPFVFQRHIAILRPDKDLLDARFLYYTMCSREFYQKADAVASVWRSVRSNASKRPARHSSAPCSPSPWCWGDWRTSPSCSRYRMSRHRFTTRSRLNTGNARGKNEAPRISQQLRNAPRSRDALRGERADTL